MRRILVPGLIFLALSGCVAPQDRLPPDLPEAVGPRPYSELLTRARSQAEVATKAFYLNKWCDLEDAGRGLEQTAKYLAKAEEVPPARKQVLMRLSKELEEEARTLRKAAQAKDEKETTAVLTRVNYKVRELRPEE
jgi:hypothetical protein